MTPETPAFEAEALDWTIRVQDPAFADWDALSAWLAADPRHADCFNRLTVLDDEIASAVRESPPQSAQPLAAQARPAQSRPVQPQPVQPQPAHAPRAGRPGRPGWALLAAGLALALAVGALLIGRARLTAPAPSARITVATRDGERRELRFPDGTSVAVAGATRLSIDPAARSARLDEGQATFSVAHDPARRFVVRMGAATVTDVGAVFDLSRRYGRSVVAVAQGEVRVEGVGEPVELAAGRRLRIAGASATALDTIAPDAATAWQQGRYSYADASIAEVVADIGHATGARIRLSPRVAARRFAGTITLAGDTEQALRRVAPVLGLSVSQAGDVWVLQSAHGAHRR